VAQYRSIRDFDWGMLVIALAICGTGVLQIYSATHDAPQWEDAWWKQIIWVGIGLILMWVTTQIDYHTLMGQVPLMYAMTVALLVGTYLIGATIFGSRRWIGYGSARFQVSEFAKLVIILLVARYLSELKGDRLEDRELFKLAGLVGIPLVLVLKQPDMGTSLTYLPILGGGLFLAGLNWKQLAIITVIAALAIPIGWNFVLKDFQKARLVSFIDPSKDPKGSGYQVIQSKIAVGQGGMWGRGVTHGSQTQLRFLPVPHTDFIFSAFAEEHGFVGIVVVLGLYFLLLMQIVQNAQLAPDRAGLYICMGIAALLLFHLLVNVGMVVGRMPVTGIPLPLMSSGGSNTLSVFLMLGLVNNVRLRRFVN
jgi:rod shape determining protein RodA